jgi:Ca-activated chloride channel homolog
MMGFIPFTNPGYLLFILAVIPLFLYPFFKNSNNASSRKLSLVLRLATAVLLVLALSGLQIARGKRNAAIIFVVDLSRSVAPVDKSGVLESISRIQSGLVPNDETGVVVFGKEAVIEHQLQRNLSITEIQSSPEAAGTNISKGLNLARAMLNARPDFSKHIVLLSDGNQTAGDALREAAICASEGIAVDVLPLATAAESSGRKLFLQECSGPESVRLGEPFEIRVSLRGNAGADILLQRYRNGALISKQRHKLSGHQEVFRIPERITAPGFHQYQIKVQDAGPNRPNESDEAGIVIYAHGRTKVLHIAEKAAGFLDSILRNQGFEVDSSDPQSAPKTIADFSSYDVVILNNVPAVAFSEDQMRALSEHVERYAGGLIMMGGSGSFGPGGYVGTPIEKALPVDMALKNREKKPALALVLVLDKSGSMGMEQHKISKLDMAKEAVLKLSGLLTPEDALGIIAFDRSPQAAMPLQAGIDSFSVNRCLRTIVAGGGTAILPAVEMAYRWVNSSPAEKKHILLLSDGQADQSERKPLVARVAGSAVVLSTVGVGSDVDRALLQKLADSAHGRAYFTDRGADLPEIFKREGLRIAGKWFVERRFKPRQLSDHEALSIAGKGGIPEMTGYVAATPKKLSEVLLAADNEDPILACWRYGLGKTLVFMSDFSSPWTQQLIGWEHFAGMWAQLVRWSSRARQSEWMHASVRIEEDDAILTVDSFDAEGNFVNFMNVHARLEYPNSASSSLELAQTASGKYESRFPLQARGSYLFTVAAKARDADSENMLHFGFDFSKLSEEKHAVADIAFMHKLADSAGGLVLNETSKTYPVVRMKDYRDVWPLAAMIAMLLFLVDLGIRHLNNNPKQSQRKS